ncbi:MAG: sensor histidine kinase [Saprospiraceae bacterium]
MQHNTVVKAIIHTLFWLFYSVILFVFDCQFQTDLTITCYDLNDLILLSLAVGLTYFNELFLLPYFFKKKAFAAYSAIVAGLVFSVIFLYCYFVLHCQDSVGACFADDLWVIALPLVFLSFIWVVIQFFEKQKEIEILHKDRLEMELKFLKSQINPHVLFNSLNTIYAQALVENDRIAEMILMLSENLKYVLNQSNDAFVDLEKDIDFIENYLEFKRLRTQGINQISYTKDIDSYNYSIVPLILVDLIENAFKYSVYKENELSEIIIDLSIKDGNLKFVCTNEYDEHSKIEKGNTTQIGLKNLRKRLDLLYKHDYSLDINRDKNMFTVELKLKLA